MADQYRRKALYDQFGIDEEPDADLPPPVPPPPEGIQQTQPEAGPMELGAVPPTAAAGPDYRSLGKFSGQMTGYDMGKFARPYDQQSEKYRVGFVNSHFDPNAGITPEYLAALKSLDLADYSGSGDKLSVANGRNGARYGSGGTADTIVGLKSGGNAKWGAWSDPALEQAGGAPMGGGADPMAFLGGGNPLDAIRAEIAKLTGGNRTPNLAALLEQFGLGGA